MKPKLKKLHNEARKKLQEGLDRFMDQQERYMNKSPGDFKEVSPEDFVIFFMEWDWS